MLFLIEYNRKQGRMVTFRSFADSEGVTAQDQRLELELELNATDVDHEVVILEAESEAAIRLSHARYFYDLHELVEKFKEALLAA
jgi:hypothetical protein